MDLDDAVSRVFNLGCIEFIDFFRKGKYCSEFGHVFETKQVYDDTMKVMCRHCSKEEWT